MIRAGVGGGKDREAKEYQRVDRVWSKKGEEG